MSATTQITWEEFLSLPEEPGKQELLDGEVIAVLPAKHSHNEIGWRIQHLMETAVDPPRVRHEEGYRLRRGWLQPDVSVTWPDQKLENDWFQHAPMIAVEVVSPSNTAEQLDRKIAAYLEDSAGEVWVFYPSTRGLMVCRKGIWERFTETYHCQLLGIVIDLAFVFGPVSE
jgi:Uma2 family endonuclease